MHMRVFVICRRINLSDGHNLRYPGEETSVVVFIHLCIIFILIITPVPQIRLLLSRKTKEIKIRKRDNQMEFSRNELAWSCAWCVIFIIIMFAAVDKVKSSTLPLSLSSFWPKRKKDGDNHSRRSLLLFYLDHKYTYMLLFWVNKRK